MIEAAGDWFLNSGICEGCGGVARYYRSDLRRNAPISNEITGYATGALFYFHRRTGESIYLDAALRSARFLTRCAWNEKLETFPFEAIENGRGLAYFFDAGIIVRGLLAAWRATEDIEFRDAAIAAGRSMLYDFPSPEGINPILALPDKSAVPWEPRWSRSPGCYQLKSAMAWHELFEVTGEDAFQQGYESALAAALADADRFLPGDPEEPRVMDRLHAHSYFLEGLLPVVDRPDCAAAFCKGVERTGYYLRQIAPAFARSDVYGQLLRARLMGEAEGVLPLDWAAAEHEAEQAAAFQLSANDSRGSGGFLFGRRRGEDMHYVNPVSTAFCAQALCMWEDREAGRPMISRHDLI
ncbi:MAG TPA: hypothetical protein VFW44_15080 [Bryobacteraceae bacterium]|nr:hypothetical protein [Bryobacteraceae bacterium]